MMSSRSPLEVCITIDTEFSIGGNFEDPALTPVAEPMVLGSVGGKEQGLGFLLDSFAEFGVRATFFVETLQTAYFGDEPMGGIARRIATAGHDVQLHLHPRWLHYERTEGPKPAPNDSCAGRTDAELRHFFEFGLSVFSRWGVPAPVAVRTGNFQVDGSVFRVAAEAGLRLSSSIAVPIYRPPDDGFMLLGGKRRVGRILEFPVFCYSYRIGGGSRLRPLCITACSAAEIISVLRQAHAHQLSPVVILTHPQKYIKKTDFRYASLRRNRANQGRLRAVLKFLNQHEDEFITTPVSSISDDGADSGAIGCPVVSVSRGRAIARMVENGINDRIWWY
jgi:peptidoglycan/xylan/chitin deacetylase (PgdA/CDA1 family)